MAKKDVKTTIYELSYLGKYYYTKTKPPTMEGIKLIDVITGLYDSHPINKKSIAEHQEIKSTSLTIIREKKK